ncbi:ABC transporter substrate-binding protein [Ferrimonas pelagia]|uniref:ABC transporter substrate-binding protein n=1 Tax=Ferrimonas pelagia TaxID=1177826 RepID=A0ABP9F7D7_9GAMM
MKRKTSLRIALLSLLSAMTAWLILTFDATDPAITLSIGGPFEFTSQEPSKDGFIYTRMQVAETLVKVEPDGTLTPGLASHWQESDDRLRWRFELREGVRFHDGTLMSADSVVQSLRAALTKPSMLHQANIVALSSDEEALLLTLAHPYRSLPALLAHYHSVILAPNSYDPDGNVHQLIGSGPYQIHAVKPPHKLVTRRFGDYWGPKAEIEYARYLTGHRAESRALQAQSNQADLIYTLDPASLEMLGRLQQVEIASESIPRTAMIKLNNGHPMLDTPEVRQAISLALDRTGMAEHVVRVPGSEAYQLFPPSLAAWHLAQPPQQQRDLAKAKALLADQGWQADDEGLLWRDGVPFALPLVTYADRPELTVIATAIQAQLREVGIQLTVVVDNSSAIPAGHHDGSLAMALVARNYGVIADPLAVMLDDNASHHGSDWGHMNWSDPALNALLDTMTQSRDADEYHALAQQAALHYAEAMPVIPVVFYTQQIAIAQRLDNFQFDPFELNYRLSEMRFTPHD